MAHPVTGGKSSSSGARPQTQNNEPSTMVDAEGDIQMSGINQLATLLISALGKAQKEEKKKKARNNKPVPLLISQDPTNHAPSGPLPKSGRHL